MSLLLLLRNGGSEPEPEVVAPRRLNVVERAPMRQYIVATSPNGAVNRWGEDEPHAVDILEELTDSDTSPGGNKSLNAAIPRLPGVSYDDMRMGTRLEVFGAGRYKVSEYRLEDEPKTSGDYLVINPAARGYQALLSDRKEAREIFLDAELGGWGEPSSERKKALGENIVLDASVSTGWQGTGETPPGINMDFRKIRTTTGKEDRGESWYDAAGISIGALLYHFVKVFGGSGPEWTTDAALFKDDHTSASALVGTNHEAATNSDEYERLNATEDGFVFARFTSGRSESGAGGAELGDFHIWEMAKVLGRHGLPLYGSWPELGVLASDVIAYALSMWVPGIRFTTGPYGSIQASRLVIPHLVFKEPVTVLEMIEAAVRFELLAWGVWPGQFGPTFHMGDRATREGSRRWRARMGAAKLTETGPQMEQSFNQVVMSWQDSDGSMKMMGPVGSGYPYEDSRCEDRDPENPLNEAGVVRTEYLTMEGVGSPEGAAQQARLFLEKCRLLNTSGEATLTGYVEDENGIEWPYYCVHADDVIEFPDSSIKGYRYIVEATRSRKSRSVNIKLDSPPASYEAILAELQVRKTLRGIS